MSNDHPLALELESLKASLDKYQHAAHTSALQLQRAHLETTEASARSKSLGEVNARLQSEIIFLRANPDTTPASLQVSELSLALRRVSDKLDLTEGVLLQRTTELAHALSEKARGQLEVKFALATVDMARRREAEGLSRERALERKCKAAEEEARMADTVVTEYADLVRSLEGRQPKVGTIIGGSDNKPLYPGRRSQELGYSSLQSASLPTNGDTKSHPRAESDGLLRSLTENRVSLQRLLHEFNAETSSLQAEINHLHGELSSTQFRLDVERESGRLDRLKLAEALVEADRCKTDDGAAGKIVSRYMRFSQSSIDMLQAALLTLKSRHAATLATLSSSSEVLSQSLALERKHARHLRDALDQLTEEISRETFGRRREIALRLRGVVREEKVVEKLGAWLRRAEEKRARATEPTMDVDSAHSGTHALDGMIADAQSLLSSLTRQERFTDDVEESSSLARVVLTEDMSRSLIAELQQEVEKRMGLTRDMARKLSSSQLPPTQADFQATPISQAPVPGLDNEPAPTETFSVPFPTTEQDHVHRAMSSQPTTPLGCSVTNKETVPDTDSSPLMDNPDEDAAETELQDQVLVITEQPSPPHPHEEEGSRQLPVQLNRASHRYDELQRAFRDCHLTLAKLKADTTSISPTSQMGIPAVHNVIYRLDDFCEDAQVELEIRIADEDRIAKGFETLLNVPGALVDEQERARAELELRTFLDGTAAAVIKTSESFTTKLDDLQHDIAQVKRVLHNSIEAASEIQTQAMSKSPPGWSSWTPPFLSASPSRSTSPAPTFGTVITERRPRRVSSISFFSRTSSESAANPYAQLGFRIPMPSQATLATSPLQHSSLRKASPSSGMYLLGLGSRSGFFSKQKAISETGTPQIDFPRERDGWPGSDTQKSQSDVE